jgi:gamma-glutamylcysteine synthetase
MWDLFFCGIWDPKKRRVGPKPKYQRMPKFMPLKIGVKKVDFNGYVSASPTI